MHPTYPRQTVVDGASPNASATSAAVDLAVAASKLRRLDRNVARAKRGPRLSALREQIIALRTSLAGGDSPERRSLRLAAAELKVRVEHKLGRWLIDHLGRGGDRRSPRRSRSLLRQLGIDPHQSSYWQRIAALPDARFEQLAQAARAADRELTTAAAHKAAAPSRKSATPRPGRSALAAEARSPGTADLRQRLDEIHGHGQQLALLLAPALAGEPTAVRPEAWRQIARLVREIDELSAPALERP